MHTECPHSINYEYFANGWLKAVKKGANTVASYIYDSSGNRTRMDFGNGTYQVFDYDSDPRYRLSSIDYAYICDDDEDIEVRGTLDVTRDKTGNQLTWGNEPASKAACHKRRSQANIQTSTNRTGGCSSNSVIHIFALSNLGAIVL